MAMDIYKRNRMVNTDGGPISVYESGEEGNPPILLLHGAMYDEARFIWHHLAPELSRTRHVYAVDFPRHGKSRPWSGTVDRECLSRVVGEVIRQFGLAPLPLIGLSMGGGVAIEYMLKFPEQVTGAVLMGPGGLGDKVANQFLSWLVIKIPGLLPAMTRYYAGMTTEKMKKTVAAVLETKDGSRDLEDLTKLMLEEARRKKMHREAPMDDWQIKSLAPFRLRMNFLPELHRISCPVLWLRGEKDPLVGQEVMEMAAKATPAGRLQIVENAGHLLPLEQPEVVCRAVMGFLEESGL